MVEPKTYTLPSTRLIPNSPHPLLHYPNVLSPSTLSPTAIHGLFHRNKWHVQWIFRYGATQPSHYHSSAHECMAVLSGTATIRFGVADTSPDLERNTHGGATEPGGLELQAAVGDVFVIPAGVAHKTFDTAPQASFQRLSPGDGHGLGEGDGEEGVEPLAEVEVSGFTMIGAYPQGSSWDFREGGEDVGAFERVWKVPVPESDPVLGEDVRGLCGLWR